VSLNLDCQKTARMRFLFTARWSAPSCASLLMAALSLTATHPSRNTCGGMFPIWRPIQALALLAIPPYTYATLHHDQVDIKGKKRQLKLFTPDKYNTAMLIEGICRLSARAAKICTVPTAPPTGCFRSILPATLWCSCAPTSFGQRTGSNC